MQGSSDETQMVSDHGLPGQNCWAGVWGELCPASFGRQTMQHSSGHALMRLAVSGQPAVFVTQSKLF